MNLDAVCCLDTSSARAHALFVLVLDDARLRRWPGNPGACAADTISKLAFGSIDAPVAQRIEQLTTDQ